MTNARSGFLRVLLLVGFLLFWEILVRIFPVPQFILPAPSRVIWALYRGAASGVYLHNLWFTLTETLLGFAIGSLVALVIGTFIAINRRVEYYLYPFIVMFQSMPKVAVVPLIVVWFGIGLGSKVVSAVLVAFFPLLVNTVVGLRSVDEDRISLMRSLAASERQIFWMLRLPSALPFIMAGLEVAMIFSLIGAIVAEFVGAEAGLGMLIQSMNFNMDVAGEFSVLFLLAIVGLVLNTIVTSVRKRVLFWDASQKGEVESMKKAISTGLAVVLCCGLANAPVSAQTTTIKVGWCAKTITSAAAPFAIATKMGWYRDAGINLELIPLPGSSDCVKLVATGDIAYSLPSVEPLIPLRVQGVKEKVFYTAYQGNIYGLVVPADSPIKSIKELKGKKIGVASMASGAVPVARALLSENGIDPQNGAQIVVVGEAAQAAALVRSHQVDALSIYDTQYALIQNAGVPLRPLDIGALAKYPSNGFVALEDTLSKNRGQAVALARGYAMGTIFALANPEAAVKILYEVFPQTKPTGKSDEQAIHDDVIVLNARAQHWKLEAGGVKRWGESSMKDFDAYEDFLLKEDVIKQKVPVGDLVTNDLIGDVNSRLDAGKIAAAAKAYK